MRTCEIDENIVTQKFLTKYLRTKITVLLIFLPVCETSV